MVITANPMIMAIKKGSNGLTTLEIEVLATPTPMNNTEPTGGVHKPIQRLSTMIIPKCTGSIPNSVTTGKNIGVKINTAGVMSMKIPTKSKIRLMIIRMTNLLSLNESNTALMDCGISSLDITQDMAMEVAINMATTAVVADDLSKMAGKSLGFNSP